LLCTCKKRCEWLQKRQDIARAAFNAFKAECLKEEENGWQLKTNPTVHLVQVPFTTETHDNRAIRWSETVCLKENGLISIRSTERVIHRQRIEILGITINSIFTESSPDMTRFFTPWFRVMTTSPPGTCPRTERINEIQEMLLKVSPGLA
jgi:hypothetical protein